MTDEIIETPAPREPVVFLKGNDVYANSRDVAEFFEKEHRNVLRDIDTLISHAGIPLPNFEQGYYTLKCTGPQRHRCFEMDQDGFTLLTMGFTGPKAIQWKIAYVKAFNTMREKLNPQIPGDYTSALRALADRLVEVAVLTEDLEAVRMEAARAADQIEDMRPSVEALDRLTNAKGSFSVRDASAQLKMKERDFKIWLQQNGWMYRRDGVPGMFGYASKLKDGSLIAVDIVYQHSIDGDKVRMQTRITAKGLGKIAKSLGVKWIYTDTQVTDLFS